MAQPPIVVRKYDPTKKIARVYTERGALCVEHPFNDLLNEEWRGIENAVWNGFKKRRELELASGKPHLGRIAKFPENFPMYNWVFSPEAVALLEGALSSRNGEELMYDRIDSDARKAEQLQKVELKALKSLKIADEITIPFVDFMRVAPFPYQKVGVNFIKESGGTAFIGDDMGLGKTMQAIAYCAHMKCKTIVVTLASLKYNWKNEVERFTGEKAVVLSELKVEKNGKLKSDAPSALFYIINYDQLKKYQGFLAKAGFRCVILDESHAIKTLSSVRTKLVFKLFQKVPHRILLSGTAVKNRPIEFYSQLKFVKPDVFHNKMHFAMRYCGAKQTNFGWDYSGSSHIDELSEMISPFYIRRTKEEVLPELPPKITTTLDYDLSPDEMREYKAIFQSAKESIWNDIGDPEMLPDSHDPGAATFGKLMALKQFCSKAKVERVKEFVEQALSENPARKVIVFSQFVQTQLDLEAAFSDKCTSLFAVHSDKERQASIDRFQTDPLVKVFVGSTIAAGTGINLTAADIVIFADLLWSPSDHEQSASRAHRIGQKGTVWVYYPVFRGTIENVIMNVLGSKSALIREILKG